MPARLGCNGGTYTIATGGTLYVATGYNILGSGAPTENVLVGNLGTLDFNLIIDTGSLNSGFDGDSRIEFANSFSAGIYGITARARTIVVDGGVTLTTVGGDVLLQGWNLTLGTGSAIRTGNGAISLVAVDPTALATPFVQVNRNIVSVTLGDRSNLTGGAVVITATANAQKYLQDDDFPANGSPTDISQYLNDVGGSVIGAIGNLSVFAGVAVSYTSATITMASTASIYATTLLMHAHSLARVSAAPIAPIIGVTVGVGNLFARIDVAGTIVTTGNASFVSDGDSTVDMVSDAAFSKAAAIAISVMNATVETLIRAGANITVGANGGSGDLLVSADRVDRSRTFARTITGTDGQIAIALSFGIANGHVTAELAGNATVRGNIAVSATQQSLGVPILNLFVIPGMASGVSAAGGQGTNSLGSPLDDAKALAMDAVIGKFVGQFKFWLKKKLGLKYGPDELVKWNAAASMAVAVNQIDVNARVGNGTDAATVDATGDLLVSAAMASRPNISATASATDQGVARNLPTKPAETGVALAFAIGYYGNTANAAINRYATVNSGGNLTVSSAALNKIDPNGLFGYNLYNALQAPPVTWTTDDGRKSLHTGDVIEVRAGHTGGGDVGTNYTWTGQDGTSVDLKTTDFTTLYWSASGNSVFSRAKRFVTQLSAYLDESTFGNSGLVDSWAQATSTGQQNAYAGSFNVIVTDTTATSLIDGTVNRSTDALYRTGHQTVTLTSIGANDLIVFAGNIRTPGITTKGPEFGERSWSPSVSGFGWGSEAAKNGKAIGGAFFVGVSTSDVSSVIGDNASLYADSLAVSADQSAIRVSLGASGGGGGQTGVNGAFLVQVIDDSTIAQIGSGAVVVVGSLPIAGGGRCLGLDPGERRALPRRCLRWHRGRRRDRVSALGGRQRRQPRHRSRHRHAVRTRATNHDARLLQLRRQSRMTSSNTGFLAAIAVSGASTNPDAAPVSGADTGLGGPSGSTTSEPAKLPANPNGNYDAVIAQLRERFGETKTQAGGASNPGSSSGKTGISIAGAVALNYVDDTTHSGIVNTGPVTVSGPAVTMTANSTTPGSPPSPVASPSRSAPGPRRTPASPAHSAST